MGGAGGERRLRSAISSFGLAVVLSALVGVVGTAVTVAALWNEASGSRHRATEQVLDQLAADVEVEVTDRVASLRSVRSMLAASPDLDADGFERFAAGLFDEEASAGLVSLMWATSPTDDPTEVEITHVASVLPADELIGSPLVTSPATAEEVRRAIAERRTILSRPVVAGASEEADGLVSAVGPLLPFTLAVFDGEQFDGLVVAVYAARPILEGAVPNRRFSVSRLDPSGSGPGTPLYGESDGDGPVRELGILGHRWEIRLDASEVPSSLPGLPIVAGLVGLLVTGLIATIVHQGAVARRLAEERADRSSAEAEESAQAFRLADERLRQGLRTAQIELWERDVDTNAGWSSGAWARGPQPMFDEFARRIHPDDRHLIEETAACDLDEVVEVEFRFLSDDGTYRWSLSRLIMVDRDGRRVLLGVQVDVHARHLVRIELERVNALLKRSNNSLVEFTRVASHDLRTPMRTIGALCDFIRRDGGDSLSAPVAAHVDGIERRVHRQLQLLDDLLTYASGEEDATRHDVDLRCLVEGIVADFRNPNGPSIADDVVAPDAVHLEQVPFSTCVRNLIDNAVKHHHDPEHGSVLVTVRMRGATVEVEVADDGPGIDRRHQLKIFEPFQRLNRSADGSGVGLALVRRTAEHFGATIDVRSEPGRGSVFFVFWPCQLVLDDAPLDLVSRSAPLGRTSAAQA